MEGGFGAEYLARGAGGLLRPERLRLRLLTVVCGRRAVSEKGLFRFGFSRGGRFCMADFGVPVPSLDESRRQKPRSSWSYNVGREFRSVRSVGEYFVLDIDCGVTPEPIPDDARRAHCAECLGRRCHNETKSGDRCTIKTDGLILFSDAIERMLR